MFEKFMPRMKSSILLLDRTHYTLLTTTKRERKKEEEEEEEEEEEDKASLFILAHFHWARYHETRWYHAEATETTTTVA